MVVDVGFTVIDPISVDVENEPGVMATEVAFVTFQLKVDVPTEATIVGDAEKELIVNGFSAFTVVDAVEVLLEVSVESAQSVVEPFPASEEFHGMEYNVPLAVDVDAIKVLEAKLVPKGDS